MRYTGKIKGAGYIIWQSKHELFHMLLGVAWAWVLREIWNEFSIKWLFFSILGSLLPDIDHVFYFFTYGKKNWYSQQVKLFLRSREWRNLVKFLSVGHKTNTGLATHNIFIIFLLIITSIVCLFFEWKAWVVVIGAMLTHFLFDIIDDLATDGQLNSNWKRWGREKKSAL